MDWFIEGMWDGLEKRAAAKWRGELRRAYGTPEYYPMRRELIARGVLDPEKEMTKIHRAAKAILKKQGVTVVNPRKTSAAVVGLPTCSTNSARQYPKWAESAWRRIGPAAYFPDAKLVYLGRGKGRRSPFLYHEATEALAHKGGTRFSAQLGHASPTVLLRESQILPFLPTDVQAKMNKLRRGEERRMFRFAGEKYGRTQRLNKTVVKRLEHLGEERAGLRGFFRTNRGRALRKILVRR